MSASRSRPKRKLEPISIEELAGTTGMSGFCSFLTRDNSVPVPALDQLETSAPDKPAADADALTRPAPERTAPASLSPVAPAPDPPASPATAPETPAPVFSLDIVASAPDTNAVVESAPQDGAPDSRFRRRPRIREALTVQDGHSLAEQAVYESMYAAGKPYRDESRILTIGLRTLAELSRMAYSNCKANVRSLVAKLAIDELPGFSYTDGRTYIVQGPREILRRRQAAGLTHVLRTRGVAFVEPQPGAPKSGAPDSSAPEVTAPPNLESSAPDSILEALRRLDPEADSAAATALWRRCREVEPAASVEDVLYFVQLKAGKSRAPMPLGFLLSAVPRCFQGEIYAQHRRRQRDRRFAADILRTPDADEEQREWARSVLGPEGA